MRSNAFSVLGLALEILDVELAAACGNRYNYLPTKSPSKISHGLVHRVFLLRRYDSSTLGRSYQYDRCIEAPTLCRYFFGPVTLPRMMNSRE